MTEAASRHPCRRTDQQSDVSLTVYQRAQREKPVGAQSKSCLAVKQQQAKSLPEEDEVGADCLGAAFRGDSDLLANWEPTELSKNPPPEEALVGGEYLGAGAAFLGDSLLLANSAPTELSKNPLEEPAAQHLNVRVWTRVGPSKHDIMHTAAFCGSDGGLEISCSIDAYILTHVRSKLLARSLPAHLQLTQCLLIWHRHMCSSCLLTYGCETLVKCKACLKRMLLWAWPAWVQTSWGTLPGWQTGSQQSCQRNLLLRKTL